MRLPSKDRMLWAVLLLQLVVAGLVYWPTRHQGFMSDAWAIVMQARMGLWIAVSYNTGYHYIPVAGAFTWTCWQLFGAHELPYQVVNILLHVTAAHLLYRFGARLLDPWSALLGSLLFIGSAAHHQVTFWPVVGPVLSISAIAYVLALGVAVDAVEDGLTWRRTCLFALWTAIGAFCYEGAVTVLPVAAVVFFTRRWLRGTIAPLPAAKDLVRRLVPIAGVVALLTLAKLRFATETSTATHPALDTSHAYLTARALVSIFTLRGTNDVLHRILMLGLRAPVGTVVWTWLVVAAVVGIAVCSYRRTLASVVLASWLGIHLAVAGVMIGILSRHLYIPAMPGALISGWLLVGLVDRLTDLARVRSPAVRIAVAGALAAVLWLGSRADLRVIQAVWGHGSRINQEIVAETRRALDAGGAPLTLTLVDMPGSLAGKGVGAYTCSNGLGQLPPIAFGDGPVRRVLLAYVGAHDGNLANGSRPMRGRDLMARASEPGNLVLFFDRGSGEVRRLTVDTRERLRAPWTPTWLLADVSY